MSPDPTENPRVAAVEQLREFGLSEYAARTFVALASLGTGTARDVSRVSDVPRTRVYDAVDELHDRGLVDVQQSSPREFWAISAETATKTFEHEFTRRAATLRTALSELEPVDRPDEQGGVWTVDDRVAVTERVLEFVAAAEEEVVYMSVGELFTEELLDALRDAADRGVDIKLGGGSTDVRERITDRIPEATTFDSLWNGADTSAGRVMMVDRDTTLVSVLVGSADTPATAETAIWGQGETNSLVVVLKAMFIWRLDELEHDGE